MTKPPFLYGAFLVFATALFMSCSGQASRATTVHVHEFDDEILRIAENARNTINIFFRHLNRPGAGESNFSVKYAFQVNADTDISTEQVWLGNIIFSDGRYYGVITSTPVYLTGIRRGDRVSFSADSISDWMFTRNGRIVGGHSIRYLLERIPEYNRTDGQRRTLQMFD
ncbi:MAG: DUF2314 domain-containing protein [Treponema sp.]|nr:DUF2314 domain-containing protein [Treponema sp.]